MSKIKNKTKKAIAKRIRITANGKLKRKHAFRSHLAHNKTTKQKRHLRKNVILNKSFTKNFKTMLHN